MTPADARRFAEAFGLLCEAFNAPASEARLEAYLLALKDLPIDAVLAAMHAALRSCRFFPKPVELREFVAGGSQEDRAQLAWGSLLSEVRRVGYIGSPSFTDPLILPAVRATWTTWEALCSTLPAEGPELVGWMKQFTKAYGAVDARAENALTFQCLEPSLRKALSSAMKVML